MTLFYSGLKNGKHENCVVIMIHDSTLLHVKTFEANNESLCYIFLTNFEVRSCQEMSTQCNVM